MEPICPSPRVVFREVRARTKGDGAPRKCAVNHVMQGYPNYIRHDVYKLAQSGWVSAHFTLGNALTEQNVSLNDYAWHAGNANAPTSPFYDGRNPNIYTVGLEWEGFATPAPYAPNAPIYSPSNPWPEKMVLDAISIHKWLFDVGWIEGEPNEDTITGHFAFNSVSRRNDPGAFWLETVQPDIIESVRGAPQGKLQPEAHSSNFAALNQRIRAVEQKLEQHSHAVTFE